MNNQQPSLHPKLDPAPLGISLLSARQTALALSRHFRDSSPNAALQDLMAPVPTIIDRARMALRDRVLGDLTATGGRQSKVYARADSLFRRSRLPQTTMDVDEGALTSLMDDVREALTILSRYQGDFDHGHQIRHSRIHLREALAACEQVEKTILTEAA